MTGWWKDREILLSVADYGVETGELDTPAAVVYFFEKSWKFEEIYTAWDEDNSRQGELQDERRQTL